MRINGLFNVIKPPGITSFQAVKRVRSWSGERRVGHAGTLDPSAAGVLTLCLGQATRLVPFLMDGTKTYCAELVLGISTDTYDAEGRVVAWGNPCHLSREEIEAALNPFRGVIEQRPPLFSALKRAGRSLYHWARAGQEVSVEKRKVEILRLELLEWSPPSLTLEIECRKGTYIRSLAQDLGEALGCGAHLNLLVRLQDGCFRIEDGISLPELEHAFEHSYWQKLIYPMDVVLQDWAAALLGAESETRVEKGSPLELGKGYDKLSWCRAYSADGRLIGLLHKEDTHWHPRRVFLGGKAD